MSDLDLERLVPEAIDVVTEWVSEQEGTSMPLEVIGALLALTEAARLYLYSSPHKETPMIDLSLTVPAVPCETCGGDGKVTCRVCFDTGQGPDCDYCKNSGAIPCPNNCTNGLVPSPEATEAAAEANWYEWHKGHSGGFKGAMRAMARASLLAAALTHQGDIR